MYEVSRLWVMNQKFNISLQVQPFRVHSYVHLRDIHAFRPSDLNRQVRFITIC